MASNPHSDFTTHNRTLPTLSNLPIFATLSPTKKIKKIKMNYRGKATRLGHWYNARMSFVCSLCVIPKACVYVETFLQHPSSMWRFKWSTDIYHGQRRDRLPKISTFKNFTMIIGPPKHTSLYHKVRHDLNQSTHIWWSNAEVIAVGKYNVSVKLQFSAEDTVHLLATAHPGQLMIFA